MRGELEQAREAIVAHPGHEAYIRWQGLWRTHAVLAKNHLELRRHLDRPSQDEALFIELIQNVHEPRIRDEFNAEVDRLLHNFVASAATLVDHTRRLVGHYEGTSFANAYGTQKSRLAQMPDASFIKDLRNYVLHYGIPFVGGSFTINSTGYHTRFEIDSKPLKQWKSWKTLSKQFLEGAGEKIVLVEPLDRYAKALDSLYLWLKPQFDTLHGEQMIEVNELIGRYNDILTGKGR